MRSSSPYRPSRTSASFPWKWIGVILSIIAVIFIGKYFWSTTEMQGDFVSLGVGSGGEASITSLAGKKRNVDTESKLYTTDSSISVSRGTMILGANEYNIDLDKWGEMWYRSASGSAPTFQLIRGRTWIETEKPLILKMKNLEVSLQKGDIVLAEQQTQVYSILYVLRGDGTISSGGRDYTLPAGRRIMISQSDLANPAASLENLAGSIDDGIKQNTFFILHHGMDLLTTLSAPPIRSSSWVLVGTGVIQTMNTSHTIEITYPTEWAMVTTDTIDISGRTLSKEVHRIVINGKDATMSRVNETFSVKSFPITSDMNDLVYRAYDVWWNILEKWLITVYSKNKWSPVDKLVPTTFATGDKVFRVTSPTENPYRTTDPSVTVSWTVPKNTVEYITVNGFRLKKYLPNSTSWYYYANTGYATMKEGFNLYEIRFYGANDTLLSNQVFTIIKEMKGSSVSGE